MQLQFINYLTDVAVNESSRQVSALEVGCTFDHSLVETFLDKVIGLKLMALLGLECRLPVFTCVCNVHTLVERGLQMSGL